MLWLMLLSAAATAVLGYLAWVYGAAYRQARRRMRAQLGAAPPAVHGLVRLEGWFAATRPGQAAAAYLQKAGLGLSPLKFGVICAVAFAALYLFAERSLGLGWLASVSVALSVLALLTHMYLRLCRQRFLRELQAQLPELALTLGNTLKAGYSINQAVTFLAEHARPPARALFRRCHEEIELGRPLAAALQEMIERYESPDLRLLLVSVLVQKQTGGNLIAALSGIATTLRRRQETLGEVQATLAQARQSVQVLPFLPFICALMFNIALPGFLRPLLTAPGLILLAVVVVLQIGAALVIRQVVRIEV